MAFFDNDVSMADVEKSGFANASAGDLEKALAAGYGSDSAVFTDGRALVPEDLESTLINVLDVMQADCKMFASLHTQPVKSTVHEINRRTGVGDYRFNYVAEGQSASEDNQDLERKLFETKYLMTKGSVTLQMRKVNTMEDAYNSEKIAAVTRLAKSAEYGMFHGNSAVIPTQFDGFETVLTEANKATVVDLHGLEIGETTTDAEKTVKDAGESMLDDLATTVFQKGGDLDRALFPPILAKQFKALYSDRMRFGTNDKQFTMDRLPDVVTAIGSSIRIQGKDAGADKMYQVKGVVSAAGSGAKRPNAPATVTVTANTGVTGSKFHTSDAGVYTYAVHAVNEYGISAAKAASATVTVANGGSVTISITPDSNGVVPKGYIITRSNKGGNILMEMVQIPAKSGTITYEDKNEDLPGTASMVLLTSTKTEPIVSWGQLMPMSTLPLPMDDAGNSPFLVALFGMLEIRAPEFCAKVKNIGYAGGLY